MQQCIQENVQLREENIALRKRISDLEEEVSLVQLTHPMVFNYCHFCAAKMVCSSHYCFC